MQYLNVFFFTYLKTPHFSQHYFPQCIMHMAISIVIMYVTVSVVAMNVTVSSSNFIFLCLTPTFHSLHFTTFVNILPKLRYFEGRNYISIS